MVLLAINHPVHIITKNKTFSPSAFIPFCDLGGNMSAMGVETELFSVPVCNSFHDEILNDQLCYKVDLNKYLDKENTERYLEIGFNFVLDYNEDRQVTFDEKHIEKMDVGLADSMVGSNNDQHAHIYLNTIGMV